jgi:hypothetical protein
MMGKFVIECTALALLILHCVDAMLLKAAQTIPKHPRKGDLMRKIDQLYIRIMQ